MSPKSTPPTSPPSVPTRSIHVPATKTFSRMLQNGALLLAFVGLMTAGCSPSSPPPAESVRAPEKQPEQLPPPRDVIAKAVDWQLSEFVRWDDTTRPLAESYSITNEYSERQAEDYLFVYDFDAKCRVTIYFTTSRNGVGGGGRVLAQSKPGDHESELRSFSSSVTLVKKGSKWYFKETVR